MAKNAPAPSESSASSKLRRLYLLRVPKSACNCCSESRGCREHGESSLRSQRLQTQSAPRRKLLLLNRCHEVGEADAKIATAKAANVVRPRHQSASCTRKPAEPAKPKPEEKKWAMNGKRDPFFSPVVQQQGSGCSTGKKCLEIDADQCARRGEV